MPVVRKWLAQEDVQALHTDHKKRFAIVVDDCWQPLFGPGSELVAASRDIKIAAQFDTSTFTKVRVIAYLYNSVSNGVDSAATCDFRIHIVEQPSWFDTYKTTEVGVLQGNSYFLAEVDLSDLAPALLDGKASIMVEARITRLGESFRDRIYLNHLGVYDSIVRLRNDVEFLDITKLDE